MPRREIVRFNQIHPNWHLMVKRLCVKTGFLDKNFMVSVSLQELAIYDYAKANASDVVAVPYAVDAVKGDSEGKA